MYVVLWVWKRVNREALPKLLRMYDMGSKLLNGISICINSLACVGAKEGESEFFFIYRTIVV